MHRRGWKTVYHNEILARGLAASDAATYQLQRHRWGTGAMQVLRKENPLVVSGLSLGQRLTYATTLLGWFDAWRSLGYLLLPLIVIATGAVPITADALTFAIAFGATFGLSQLALWALSRGCHRPVLTLLFEFVRMTPNLLATATLFGDHGATFRVTPKGRTGDGRTRTHVPRLLTVILGISFVAAAWYALTVLGVTPVHYAVPWAVHASFAWMLVNVTLVWLAIRRVRSSRYAAERRSSVRFATDMPARLDGLEATVRDVSLTGARIELPVAAAIAEHASLTIELPGGQVLDFTGASRSTWTDARGRPMVGFEFDPEQDSARARLALALFVAEPFDAEPAVEAKPAAPRRKRRARVETAA